ncbi:MAG: hypothetical protein R2792_13020 [Saprospiraceae bacterium]
MEKTIQKKKGKATKKTKLDSVMAIKPENGSKSPMYLPSGTDMPPADSSVETSENPPASSAAKQAKSPMYSGNAQLVSPPQD